MTTVPPCLTQAVWAEPEVRARTVPRRVSEQVEDPSGRLFYVAEGDRVRALVQGADGAAALARDRRDAFAFAPDPWLYLPSSFRAWLQRLLEVDLGAMVGAGPGVPPELRSFVARVGDQERLLRIDLEQLWLWSSAEQDGEDVVHQGRWSLRVAGEQEELEGRGEALACPGSLKRRRYELVTEWPVVSDPAGRWERVACSFLTLPLDVLTAQIQRFFYEGGGPSQPRRSRRRQ